MVFRILPTINTSSTKMYPTTYVTSSTAAPTPDPASRVDPRTHHPRVAEMVRTPFSYGVIDYFLNAVILTVASALIGPTDRVAFGLKTARTSEIITSFVRRGGFSVPDILVALVYLDRVRPHLEVDSADWVCERLGIGALITACKYANDALPGKPQFWAAASIQFGIADINRIEREFLALLSFDMRITNEDLLPHADGLSREAKKAGEARRPYMKVERAEYHYPIHPLRTPPLYIRSPEPATQWSRGSDLPELMYPDSPSSDSTPPVITPPGACAAPCDSSGTPQSKWTMPAFNPIPALQELFDQQSPVDREGPAIPHAYAHATRLHTLNAARTPLEHERVLACARWYTATDTRAHYSYPPRGGSSPLPRFAPFSPPAARYGAGATPPSPLSPPAHADPETRSGSRGPSRRIHPGTTHPLSSPRIRFKPY
ncbi:hypothetical protein BC628DRAFT_1417053 [Trametes gibbosa]|nr:hypothetical protein BC628DRAFT_1417053 [Trametes gibbosa]